MKKNVFALVLSLVTVFSSAYADHQMKLVEVHADEPAGFVSVIMLDLSDQNEILGMSSSDNQGLKTHFSFKQLSKGVVVFRYRGNDSIAFDQVKFDPVKGGTLQLTFMRKFKLVKNDYRTIGITLEQNTSTNELDPFLLYVNEPSDKKPKSLVNGVDINVERTLGVVTGVQEIRLFQDKTVVRDYDPATLPQVPNLIGN